MVVLVSALLGLIVAFVLAMTRIERVPLLSQISAVMVSFIRGTPIFIQMFVVYYGLPMVLLLVGINIMRMEKIIFVFIAYALNVGAFFSEIIRSSILAVPREQWDAAYAVGHGKLRTYIRIVIPQSISIATPSLGVTMTGLLQDTSLTFAMGIVDVIGRSRSLGTHYQHALEGYVVAGIIFVVLALIIDWVFGILAKRARTRN
jgi:L-cystine transport system permease protein